MEAKEMFANILVSHLNKISFDIAEVAKKQKEIQQDRIKVLAISDSRMEYVIARDVVLCIGETDTKKVYAKIHVSFLCSKEIIEGNAISHAQAVDAIEQSIDDFVWDVFGKISHVISSLTIVGGLGAFITPPFCTKGAKIE